ncbi:histidinol dehydrogenase [Putridiphycobacter roseus]|uniref:Histidinol dehydrogenase n=1 Tax=Putridiphycobacter roseus TaxID=2219161 RepID=A0A2W1N9P1_9FLAO|nr:histidinol dehydrogenase [Putridiphycobacter roseus]PZE15985.1 histidinol dehydrogenase [Putridiphycobacter roseus]
MKIIEQPLKSNWSNLVRRPIIKEEKLDNAVRQIMLDVKQKGDLAIFQYNAKFDGVNLDRLIVSPKEIEAAILTIPNQLKAAIEVARKNITAFHQSQHIVEPIVETTKGVKCWRKSVAIESVGLYIPAGTAPLFSTVLMLGIPAKIAGCKKIVLCTPVSKSGKVPASILYTAQLIGVDIIYKMGGAQAIAGLTYGTESIQKVDKIFGPGNQFVAKAKEFAQQAGIAIDLPAGPSELLIIADQTAVPEFVAADLLSQAEHGVDSQVILLSNDKVMIEKVLAEVVKQLVDLPRQAIAKLALENSKVIFFSTLEDCVLFSNTYAPEHLILAATQTENLVDKITNAGSVFIGNYSCESAGDYASGTNHTLPTNGFAKTYSGVSLDSFVKKITFQELSKEGIKNIGEAIEVMATEEKLYGHKNAVTLRLNNLEDEENK